MKMVHKNALWLLLLVSGIMGVSSCLPVDPPVIVEAEELEMTFDGNYFYQFAALQEARLGLQAVNKALDNQQFDQLSYEELLSLKTGLTRLADNIVDSYEYVAVIKCKPPFCPPPNPCSDRPDGIVCDKMLLSHAALKNFRLPVNWADGRVIELQDEQGEPVVSTQQGGESFFDQNLNYQLDVPDNFKNGFLVITENRNGVLTTTTLDIELE